MFEIERERALTRANAALALFETEARNAGISYGLQALTDLPVEAAASARLYDLTIVLQPEADRDTCDNTMPQEILFQSGGPVLLIPLRIKARWIATKLTPSCANALLNSRRLIAKLPTSSITTRGRSKKQER